MKYINLTPHTINLNDGRSFESSGVARVSVSFSSFENDVCEQIFGDVQDLPEPKDDVRYIVSGMVLSAVTDRDDVVAPATGHPECQRNEKGHIVSVPGFVR